MSQITLTIDGKAVTAESGKTILEAALENGIYIPHLCSHEDLLPAGACRMCMVKVEGREDVVASCSTKIEEGMVVDTHDKQAEKLRKFSCDLLMKTHPTDCTGCPKYGKCQLQSIIQMVDTSENRMRPHKITTRLNDSNPIILHEMQRCILCGRCVRACQEMRGVGAIKFQKVDGRMRVVIDGEDLKNAGCRFCTACVEVCPTGSIREHEVIAAKLVGKSREEGFVPCRSACPAKIDVPKYLRFIREGNYAAAAAVVREKAPLPWTLGFVCTHPCEDECKRNYLNEPIAIRNLKRYAAAHDDGSWKQNRRIAPATGKRVAVIGSGPAGLTAAYYLGGKGHEVTIFESEEKAGGQLRYGIPGFRLPRDIVDGEIAAILENSNITLRTGSRVESAPALLEQGFDAVFAAIGTHQGTRLGMPGNDLEGVYVNANFLKAAELGTSPEVGKRVMVLGGGNVALDCVAVARRLGAETVHAACLESYDKMTASAEERRWAEEEGLILHNSVNFPELVGENGHVTGVKLIHINSFSFGPNGETILDIVPDSEEIIPVDSVIFAIGQRPKVPENFGLELGRGRIAVHNDCETSVPGIFAAGDGVTGTASVIKAVAGARCAAEAIDRYLGGDGCIDENLAPEQKRDPCIGRISGFGDLPRRSGDVVPPEERKCKFMTMDLGLNDEDAACEAGRCLQCDLRPDIAPQLFWANYSKKEE